MTHDLRNKTQIMGQRTLIQFWKTPQESEYVVESICGRVYRMSLISTYRDFFSQLPLSVITTQLIETFSTRPIQFRLR